MRSLGNRHTVTANRDALKEKPQQWGWGALGLGLLIFETKTHPVTAGIMIDERIWFLRPLALRSSQHGAPTNVRVAGRAS